MSISENLITVRENIAQAAKKSGRSAADVKIVAVTKLVGTAEAQEAMNNSISALGENRVQSLLEKYEVLGDRPEWHLIGHLQTNKVKYISDKVSLIHSADSIHLVREINERAAKSGKPMDYLLQINVSGEESKFGISRDEVMPFIESVYELEFARLKGLMTIAPNNDNPEDNRKYFCELREIFEKLRSEKIENADMKYLSMGMSKDYCVAVSEGANIVRIGNGIFHI